MWDNMPGITRYRDQYEDGEDILNSLDCFAYNWEIVEDKDTDEARNWYQKIGNLIHGFNVGSGAWRRNTQSMRSLPYHPERTVNCD